MRLGLGIGRRAPHGGPAAPPFDPLSLFSGELGFYNPLTDISTLWEDTGRTIQATVGSTVAVIDDLSGNAAHASQSTAANRAILRAASVGYYLEFDGVSDNYPIPANLTTGNSTLALAYDPNGANFIALRASGTIYLLVGQSASTSTVLTGNVTSLNSVYFGGTLFSGTQRGQVYTSAQAATTCIVDFTAGASWASPNIGYHSATFPASLNVMHGILLINRSLTAGERTSLNSFLAARV